MPRKPTGNPTGRPKGSGQLGEVMRLTVRIPLGLYDRLDTYAAGRSFTRGTPQLAVCVREALELYLDTRRQTKSIPMPSSESNGQPESEPAPTRDEMQQTETISPAHEDTLRQTLSVPGIARESAEPQRPSQPDQAAPEDILAWGREQRLKQRDVATPAPVVLEESRDDSQQTEKSTQAYGTSNGDDSQQTEIPPYDASKYTLGKLCPRSHEHGTTGQSLLRSRNKYCLACDREISRERQQAKRQTRPA
jgi:hypothetical protein